MPDTPNPDVNSTVTNDYADTDIERENDNGSGKENEEMPVPPDNQSRAPVVEPPDVRKPSIDENTNEPKRLV